MNKFTGFILITLFIDASADSFTNGMSTGYISSNIERRFSSKVNKTPVIKYNNFTRDTGLEKFPPNLNPQCIPEKIKIVNPPLTLVQRLATAILFTLIICMFYHILFIGPTETREWFIGYVIGRMLEDAFNNDD
jgi:hypothetical protein